MIDMSSLGQALAAPGLLGSRWKEPVDGFSPGSMLFPLLAFVALPSLGFAWVLLYTVTSPASFLLVLQHATEIDLLGTGWNPYLLLFPLGGIVTLMFWFVPSLFMFTFNFCKQANRKGPGKLFCTRFFAGASYCFGIHLPFLTLSFLLMATRATFFWGMRTVEDVVFTIALLVSLGVQLASQVIFSKNYFARGFLPSLAAVILYVIILAGAIVLLF